MMQEANRAAGRIARSATGHASPRPARTTACTQCNMIIILGIMRPFHAIRLFALLLALGCIPACRTTPLNKQEAADWYARYASMVRWVGYQGSDQQFHYYIARVMDDWNLIRIRKDELKVDDERPYSTASSAPFYHYLVDSSRDYRKTEL